MLTALFIVVMIFLVGCLISMAVDDCSDGSGVPILIIVALLALPLGTGITYLINYSNMSKLEAFYDANLSAYQYTVEKTQDINIEYAKAEGISDIMLLDTGGLTYLELGKISSERLTELRDEVKNFNKDVAFINRQNRNWLLGLFYPEIPERIKMIVLK